MDPAEVDNCPFEPPAADRVAARALVLAAVSCRGLIEKNAQHPGAEALRQRIVAWLDTVGAAAELEPDEAALLSTPVGLLARRATLDAGWRIEGAVVLAWALHRAELPALHAECEPGDLAEAMGFLGDQPTTPLHQPILRDEDEIGEWADTYLTLHWRLRQFSLEPAAMNLTAYVSACTWGPLRVDHLELLDGDLAIGRTRIDKAGSHVFHRSLSIARERHRAFNWLLGFERLYSDITTDT